MILAIKTDNPEAEISIYNDNQQISQIIWYAHRQLGETIHQQIQKLLKNIKLDWGDLTGIIFYQGPGSFTGLRIGASVANTLSYSLNIPIVGVNGKNWQKKGLKLINQGIDYKVVDIIYGNPVNITKPKK